jgi:O-antigen/teichoic acid export membrane protein
MYTAGLVGFMYEPLTKILVSHFMGSTEVGIFDIGLRVRNQLFGLALRAFSPLFPMISQLKDPARVRMLVHDAEQKTLMLSLPVIAVVVLTVKPAVSMFFLSNVDAIAVTVACIVSASLLASISVIPNYQFLLAKGHVRKTLIVQCTNVIVNVLVLLLVAPWVGYYAVVAANVLATLSSGGLLLYYQRRFLGSLILDSVRQGMSLCAVLLIALGAGFLAGRLAWSSVWALVAVPPVVLCATAASFRAFDLLSGADIARYMGGQNGASRLFTRLLCRTAVQP